MAVTITFILESAKAHDGLLDDQNIIEAPVS
jgi:hypothetical protein